MRNKIIKNIPNALTFSRIVSCILGAIAFILGNIPLAIGLYIYGAVSDFFDGLAARKLNAFSEFGRKLDAFSDKIYAGSLLIPSILSGNLLMLIPLMLELKISQVNLKSQKLGFKPKTQQVGRIKTVLLFPTMIIGLLSTILVEWYPLLLMLVPVTTLFQVKSIMAYNKLFLDNCKSSDYIKNVENDLVEIAYRDEELKKVKEVTYNKERVKSNYKYYELDNRLDQEDEFYIDNNQNKGYVRKKKR